MKKLLTTILALATALAAAATAASATPLESDRTTAVAIQDVQFVNPTTDCPGGTVTFSLLALQGDPAGDGTSCIKSTTGCDPFAVGCRQVTLATFTFNLPGGSVTAPMTLHERFLTENSVVQLGIGKINSATGTFARAHARIEGGGIVTFTDTGVDSGLVYLVRADS